ncbi:9865_t:CDS:2 [Cetraspora pellucida]|uniref:9865_t:CDS:1 n=1 Tax=Cetraspora pellucida TaxID=1433469 RepID=A0A9N9AJY9_9GLOM|nr:9865_t:CDS:2 [Cetraspora pellucida]
MDQSESIQNDQSIYNNCESEIFYEMDQNECIQNDQSTCNNCESDHENDANDQSDQELALSNNKKKFKIITKSKSSFKSSWLNEFKWLQYDKLPYFVQMSRELESPFIIDSSITYENEVSGHEFAFAISNIIKTKIWEEIRKSVSFGIMIDESTDISTNKHIDIYIMYPNISGNIKTHFLQLLALEQSDAKTITTKLIRLSDGAFVMIGTKNSVAQKLSQLRLKKLKEIRWLGWYKAVENFVKTLLAVLLQLQNDNNKVASDLYQRLCNWRLLGFFYFIYDVLGQLSALNKFFQKHNLYFHDIIPMIDVTIDVYEYASIVTTEIRNHFPDCPLLATMKILNPVEWSCKKEELLEFGNDELQVLLNHYGSLKTINGQNFLSLVDSDSCIVEWSDFKNIVFSNFLSFSSRELLPILIYDYSDIFSNITKLVHITNSIPFSSVDCERRFSKQNTIKTYLHNSLNTLP